ncbi:MAG: delta(1)-pyrroline-2-carboxylate reductase family protein [Chloroflexota bacterium]
MRTLNADETRRLLAYGPLADELAGVLRDRKAGRAYAPPRLAVPLAGGGVLLLMPAADQQIAITKLATVHTGNSVADLPAVQADVIVMEAATGHRLLTLDGNMVTARRTAALSMLAARLLAVEPSGPLLVVGGGTQARSHVEAFVEGLGVREVYTFSRSLQAAEELAAHARTLAEGVEARPVADVSEVLARVSLVVTATTSSVPVLPAGAVLRDDVFVVAVGAYTPQMAELPPDLVLRSRVYVDTLEGAQSDAGDLIQAGVDWERVTSLQDALDLPPLTGGPVIFKSVGNALWDLAAAKLALRG